jgi:signal transduction histidine kinase
MRYLNTNYELFVESHQEEDGINKYEIVEFIENYTIKDIYGVDRSISINIRKGDKVKLYFNLSESQEDNYCITAIRPIEVLHNEAKKSKAKKNKKTDFNLSELWEGNFVLNAPMVINKTKAPFTIEKYI